MVLPLTANGLEMKACSANFDVSIGYLTGNQYRSDNHDNGEKITIVNLTNERMSMCSVRIPHAMLSHS